MQELSETVEMITLDKEMAEERAETLQIELGKKFCCCSKFSVLKNNIISGFQKLFFFLSFQMLLKKKLKNYNLIWTLLKLKWVTIVVLQQAKAVVLL